MSKHRKDKLLINLIEGEKYKHRVAMVTDEGVFNQHEPNSNMARMFVVMLMIHVVVIGGIIVYDFINEDEKPASKLILESPSAPTSALPAPPSNVAELERQRPIEEYATYEWRSGDSIPSVARKLGVSEEQLIQLNMLDKGTQISQNTILRYPKRPVVRALAVDGAAPVAAAPVEATSLAAAVKPVSLAASTPEPMGFQATIEKELVPTPVIQPKPAVMETVPVMETPKVVEAPAPIVAEAAMEPDTLPVPSALVELPKNPVSVTEAPPAPVPAPPAPKLEVKAVEKSIPKAIPVPRPEAQSVQAKPTVAPAVKPAPTKPAAAGTYTVKPGETLYGIARRHNVSVKALQEANKIARPESLRDGMKLVIPAGR